MIQDLAGGGCDVAVGRLAAAVLNAAGAFCAVPADGDFSGPLEALERAVKVWRARRRQLGDKGVVMVKLADLEGG